MSWLVDMAIFSSTGSGVSALIVDVEVDRPAREFFKGPRWVSLNSITRQCSFQVRFSRIRTLR